MPLYEYRCRSCGFEFEVLSAWSKADSQSCPECGAKPERLISSFAGSGSCEDVGVG